MDESKLTEQLIEVLQHTSKLSTQLESVQATMADLMNRLEKVEDHGTKITLLEERMNNVDKMLRQGSEHFDKLDKEVNALQDAEGDKAKQTLKSIWNYILIAIVGAVLSNLGNIFHALGSK